MTLAALLMLWTLAVPMPLEQRLLGEVLPPDQQPSTLQAKPVRQAPLQEQAWDARP